MFSSSVNIRAWALVAIICGHVSAHKVVSMPFSHKRNTTGPLYKRAPFAISLDNYLPYGEYFVTALVGTPPQEIDLIVDTGSSDTWMFGAGSCQAGPCEGGSFNIDDSSTAKLVPGGQGAFFIRYQTQGSGVVGDYFTDTFSVGGVALTDFTMAVATKAQQVPSGIMGIGLAVNEAGTQQGLGQYQNYPQLLKSQGKISTTAFSLYLDDLSSSSGTILFGGYDNAKFQGDMKLLPIQLDDQSHAYTSFTVSWTSLGIQTPTRDETYSSSDFVVGAVLDTGTTLTYLPTEIYEPLASYFKVTELQSQDITLIDCDFAKNNPGQLVFGLGGDDGVQVAVDYRELVIPIYSPQTGEQVTDQNGQLACQFGLSEAGSSISVLLGQTFLRSAYVLYDLDNKQIGVAQTIFDSTESDIVEYTGTTSSNRVQTDSNGPTVTDPADTEPDNLRIVATTYTATVSYPSDALPSYFPTTIPPGPTGIVSDGSTDENGSSGSSGGSGTSSSGSRNPSSTGGTSGGSNSGPGLIDSLQIASVVATGCAFLVGMLVI